jgi:hypothetical protein
MKVMLPEEPAVLAVARMYRFTVPEQTTISDVLVDAATAVNEMRSAADEKSEAESCWTLIVVVPPATLFVGTWSSAAPPAEDDAAPSTPVRAPRAL